MSRSNGSTMNTGGRSAPRSPAAEPNAPNWGNANPAQYARQPAANQGDLASYQQPYRGQPDQASPADPYGQHPGYRHPQQAQPDPQYAPHQPAPYPSQGYAQPQAQQPDPYYAAAQAAYPAQGYAQPASQSHAQQGPASGGYQGGYLSDPGPAPLSAGYAQPAAHSPAPSGYENDPFQGLRGATYDQWSGQSGDPRAASYGHGGFAAAPQPSAAEWQPGAAPAYAPHPAEQGFDLTGYGGPHGGYEPALSGGAPYDQQNAVQAQYHDEEGDYEAEQPPRRGRATMIIAALVAAIGIGGGLAYGYKELLGSATPGAPPVVKSAAGPSKVKPTNPGGKQFAHSDSKIMGRLGEDGKAEDAGDDNGARKVATLTVGRDGSIVPPAAPPQPSAAAPAVAVPGLMVVDAFGSRTAAQAAAPDQAVAPAAAAQPIVVNPPAPPEKPVVIAKTSPSPKSDKPEASANVRADADSADTARPAASTPPPVRKKVAAAATVAAPPAAAAASPATAGYVAVLASVPASGKSRMDALRQFADMQQKYGSLLQNKTPDVQEADLGNKGTYHRLLVGPPSSRDQAASLCSGLKAAGYNDCWVTAY